MKLKALSSTLVAAVFLLAGLPESYADGKIYAGSECKKWNEADPALILYRSGIYNPSTRAIPVDCPAVRDRGANIANSWIRVIDRHPGDQICARLVAIGHTGTAVVARQGRLLCTGNPFNSPSAVVLRTGELTGVPGNAHYYFSVTRVPARYGGSNSGIVNYAVSEINGPD
jgi:hypothetical protein